MVNLNLTSSSMTRVAGAASSSFGTYDDHTKAHHGYTHAQLTLLIAWVFSFVLWWFQCEANDSHSGSKNDSEKKSDDVESGTATAKGAVNSHPGAASEASGSDAKEGDVVKNDVKAAKASSSSFPQVPSLEQTLRNVVVMGFIMFYFFLCDYLKVFPNQERVYNRDMFLFLLFILFLVASAFTVTPTKDIILNRDQTEEWKGWMQVMFVWYHYFAAKEWYNWIRVYIACYVWMTGFGNFSFFWVRGDYSLWRVLKMLFRMNFLVLAVILVTDNEYMLYYICAMHSYWFLSVYFFMRCLSHWNTHRWKMALKFLAYILANALIFEIPGNCSVLFRPLWFIFQFHDGVRDVMHEWEFRGGLDHWACFFGMLCAYNYPHFEAFLKFLESSSDSTRERMRKVYLKAGLVAVAVGVGVGWYFCFMRADKFRYNATHCYTSLLPILVYLVLRNSFPVLRRHYLGLFAFLGKITLETYLSQLHVYLQSNAKHLIGYLPAYPLLNFALATVIYLSLSQMLFHITVNVSAFFIQKDWRKAMRLSSTAAAVLGVSAAISLLIKTIWH